ncbi:hypothetical protein AB0B57_03115 [Micromonospora sp. NPDC049101]|uniref:hypothetical protein n=1 Tax=Micromonospora sp. NPDC049101 TaxID=3155032 RepID=UPI0033F08E95
MTPRLRLPSPTLTFRPFSCLPAHVAGDVVELRSAGSEPANQIIPISVQAMHEVDIDTTANAFRKLEYDLAKPPTRSSPWAVKAPAPFPGRRDEDWQLTDSGTPA